MNSRTEIIIDCAARAAHEVNRAWCFANGDMSQMAWDYAPKWQRDSALAGVRWAIANPMANAIDQHGEWARHKRADGWVYGLVKDATAKTHPCLVDYHELPPDQRAKDQLFVNVVRAVLRAGGVQ